MSNTAETSKKKTVWYSKEIDKKLEYHAFRLSQKGNKKVTVTDLIGIGLKNLVKLLDKEDSTK